MKRPQVVGDFASYARGKYTPLSVLADKLNRSITYVDDDGYDVELVAGALQPSRNRIAWVDYYQRNTSAGWVDCNYYLRIKVEDQQVFEWTVKTYNPYFGVHTYYMNWHEDYLVYVYAGKHKVYGITISESQILKLIELGSLGSQLRVDDDILSLVSVANYNGYLERYHIPLWEELPSISEEKARKLNIVE